MLLFAGWTSVMVRVGLWHDDVADALVGRATGAPIFSNTMSWKEGWHPFDLGRCGKTSPGDRVWKPGPRAGSGSLGLTGFHWTIIRSIRQAHSPRTDTILPGLGITVQAVHLIAPTGDWLLLAARRRVVKGEKS